LQGFSFNNLAAAKMNLCPVNGRSAVRNSYSNIKDGSTHKTEMFLHGKSPIEPQVQIFINRKQLLHLGGERSMNTKLTGAALMESSDWI